MVDTICTNRADDDEVFECCELEEKRGLSKAEWGRQPARAPTWIRIEDKCSPEH